MKPENILITGAAGFAGSHVYDDLSQRYPDAQIAVLDKMTYAADIHNIANILKHKQHRLIVGDVTDFDLCLEATSGKDLVIHLAAESHVGRSYRHSIDFTRTNALGTHMLMEACRQNEVPKIIHTSTDEVYGESCDRAFDESSHLNPTNPYSASKAAAEMVVKGYVTSYHLPVITIRANNLYGTRQFPEKILPRFILRALNGLPLTIHGNGTNKRHYLCVQDFCQAIHCLIEQGRPGEAYNIASSMEMTNLEVAQMINQALSLNEGNIRFIADRPFNDKAYAIDDSKIKALGWQPTRELRKDLPDMIDWYRKSMDHYDLAEMLK